MRAAWMYCSVLLALSGAARAEDSYYKTIVDDSMKGWTDPEGDKATPAQQRAAAEYVIGNVINTMFHEFGHAMVSEFNINVLGKEEDAVDSFADVTMIADEKDPVLDEMMSDVVRAWFDSGKFNADQGYLPDYADVHSVDEQRGYTTVCLLVGASEERFGKIADEVGLTDGRREGCEDEYVRAYNSWVTALGDNYLNDGEAPKNKITVKWDEPPAELKPIADFLKASGAIEALAEQIENTFRLPNPVSIVVTKCDEENAYWSPEDRSLTLCYEIAEGYRQSVARRRHPDASAGDTADDQGTEETDDQSDDSGEEPADTATEPK